MCSSDLADGKVGILSCAAGDGVEDFLGGGVDDGDAFAGRFVPLAGNPLMLHRVLLGAPGGRALAYEAGLISRAARSFASLSSSLSICFKVSASLSSIWSSNS